MDLLKTIYFMKVTLNKYENTKLQLLTLIKYEKNIIVVGESSKKRIYI